MLKTDNNRWFLDTEFADTGSVVKLISIALVSEQGETYYAVACDGWTTADCDPWVQANVLPKLPDPETWKPRAVIADELRALLLRDGTPEIWAYFCSYDWVVLCQLWGRMVDLPTGMPMFCWDLKCEMDRLGIGRDQLPDNDDAHDALADAKWTMAAWKRVRELEQTRRLGVSFNSEVDGDGEPMITARVLEFNSGSGRVQNVRQIGQDGPVSFNQFKDHVLNEICNAAVKRFRARKGV